jgi:AcrR family transcriptional regulator
MRYEKSAVSSSQIVQAAIRVLAQKGYARTSLLDIAREAGMSKGALHYHFPTKEALLAIVLETACTAVAQRTDAAWQDGENPLVALRMGVRVLWDVRAARSDEALVVADLLAQSLHDPSLRPQLARFFAIGSQQVADYVTTHLPALGLEPTIPLPILSRIIVGMLDGLMLQVYVDPDALDPDEVVDAFVTMAVSLFRPRTDTP